VMEYPKEVVIIAIGPLTNIFIKLKRMRKKIKN
jgi:inosine-uridine nucleoside N-ribohydrolase